MAEQTPDSIITTQRNGQTIVAELFFNEAVIIGLKPPSTNGRRFSPISITGHFPI